jgi:hypothetical protein
LFCAFSENHNRIIMKPSHCPIILILQNCKDWYSYLKWGCFMKKKGWLRAAAAVVIAASMVSFSGCAQAFSAQRAQGGAASNASGETTYFGKVTAVDGAKITLALGTFERNNPNSASGGRPQGNRPGQSGGWQKGDGTGGNPASGNGDSTWQRTRQSNPGNGQQNGEAQAARGGRGFGGDLVLTGETKTITITDTGILTKMGMGMRSPGGRPQNDASDASKAESQAGRGAAASLTDITVGSILRITASSSDTLVSVQIMGSGSANASSSK